MPAHFEACGRWAGGRSLLCLVVKIRLAGNVVDVRSAFNEECVFSVIPTLHSSDAASFGKAGVIAKLCGARVFGAHCFSSWHGLNI